MTDDPQYGTRAQDAPPPQTYEAPPEPLFNRVIGPEVSSTAAQEQVDPKPEIGPFGARNLGAIEELSTPYDWVQGKKVENAGGLAYSYQWNPPGRPEVAICVSVPAQLSKEADGRTFNEIISKGEGYQLSPAEIASLRGTIGEKANPQAFTPTAAVVREIEGHKVLAISGEYTGKAPRRSEAVYVPVTVDGRLVQEVSYTAPTASFQRFGDAAGKSLDSLNLK